MWSGDACRLLGRSLVCSIGGVAGGGRGRGGSGERGEVEVRREGGVGGRGGGGCRGGGGVCGDNRSFSFDIANSIG